MSSAISSIWYLLDYGWSVWSGLLRHQTDWWDPYGATVGAILLVMFLGLAVKFVRE